MSVMTQMLAVLLIVIVGESSLSLSSLPPTRTLVLLSVLFISKLASLSVLAFVSHSTSICHSLSLYSLVHA